MRWPFGRSSNPAPGASIPAMSAGLEHLPARPHDAWRSLPVVQRAIGDPPVVAPARPFASSLATRRAPEMALEPLGHEVSPLAAPGLLIGLGAPTGALNVGRVELPVQRATAGDRTDTGEERGWSSDHAPDAGLIATIGPTASAAGASTAGASGSAAAGPLPIQRVPARPVLTTAATTGVGATPAGLLDLRPVRVRDLAPIAVQALGAPRPDEASLSAVAAAPLAQAAMPAVVVEPPARRPSVGQARRLGLGAPLPPIGSPVAQRTAGGSDTVGSSPAGLLLAPNPSSSAAAGPASIPAIAEVAGQAVEVSAPRSDPGPPELEVVRPLSIQRLIATGPAVTQAGSDEASIAAPPATGWMIPAEGPDGHAGWGPAIAETGVEPIVQATPANPVAGLGGPIQASSPLALVSIVGRPAEGPRSAGRSEPGPFPAGPIVARSVAEPARILQVPGAGRLPSVAAEGVARRPTSATAPRPGASPSQTIAAGAETPDSAPFVAPMIALQRAVEIPEIGITAPGAGDAPGSGSTPGIVPGVSGTAAGGSPSAAPADRERELDELARRLYGRIRSRLSAELLLDRERAGMITDLR